MASGVLLTGQIATSPSGQFALLMQGDGNLVVYGNGTWIWASGSRGSAQSRLIVQSDGNVVIYDNGRAIWSTGTVNEVGTPQPIKLLLRDDGALAVQLGPFGDMWRSDHSRAAVLAPGTILQPGSSAYSPSGQYRMLLQFDGNLVVYGNGGVLWNTGTWNRPNAYLAMQDDGNLVLYAGAAIWASNTRAAGQPLTMLDNGNIIVGSDSDRPFWWSGNPLASVAYPGTTWTAGAFLRSPDGLGLLVFQRDGNLAFYYAGSVLFGQYLSPLAIITFGADGSFSSTGVNPNGSGVMATLGQATCQGVRLEVTRQRTANLECANGGVGFSTHVFRGYPGANRTWGGVMRPGQAITAGGYLASPTGAAEVLVQAQPQILITASTYPVTSGGGILWTFPIAVAGTEAAYLIMQPDGNLVLYGGAGAVWSTQTFVAGSIAVMQDDGNLVVYAPNGTAVWNACSTSYWC